MSIANNMILSLAIMAAPLAATASDLQCQQAKGTTTAALDQAAGVLKVTVQGQTLVYKVSTLEKTGDTGLLVIGYSEEINQHAILNLDTKSGKAVLQAVGTSANLDCVQL